MKKEELNKELLEKAEKLKIDVEDYDTEDDLQEEIERLENKDDDKEIEFWKLEAQKAFEKRDSLKRDVRRLKKQNDDLKKSIANLPDSEEIESWKKKMNTSATSAEK